MDGYKEPTPKQKQIKRILEYMKVNGSITHREAEIHCSVTRLPSRVYDLKNMGYPIKSKRERGLNQFGEKCNYNRYYMGGDDNG
jgi:hypothetical protein